MFGELRQTAEEQISDVPLRRLVTELLDENRGAVCRIPAALVGVCRREWE